MPRVAQRIAYTACILFLAGEQGRCQYYLGATPPSGGLGPLFNQLTNVKVNSVVTDTAGAVYAVGQTSAPGLATPGAYQTQDAQARCFYTLGIPPEVCYTGGFIAKLSADGEIVWATYLGGTTQSESDSVQNVALDSHGNVWISGLSGTLDFPTTPSAYQPNHTSEFLAKLSPDGSHLLYSTFTTAQLMAIGPDDEIYLGGSFAIKFDPAKNQLIYNTPIPLQAAYGILDNSGTFYLGGSANSNGFPTTPGVYSHPSGGDDIALEAINPDGSIKFSTVISADGGLSAIALDVDGNLYLAGYDEALTSPASHGLPLELPVTPNAMQPAWKQGFLVKLSPGASSLLYATYLGNGNTEGVAATFWPLGIKVGQDGKLRMVGVSGQYDIHAQPGAFDPCGTAGYLQFSSDLLSIEYATAIPGEPFNFDAMGNVYVNNQPPIYFQIVNVTQPPTEGPACAGPLEGGFGVVGHEFAPGLLVSILGFGIGPAQPATFTLDASGRIPTELAGTQVLFGGIPAPILATGPNRIDAIVPFELATPDMPHIGLSSLTVYLNGQSTGSLQCYLTPAQPTLFTQDGTGVGAAAWNQDGTPNSPTNPAHVGDIVSFYGTGAGPLAPTPVDGFIPQSPQSILSFTPVPVYGGMNCSTIYAGDAPGEVEGIFQYNCQVQGKPNFPFSFYVADATGTSGAFVGGAYTLYVQ